MSTSVTPRDGPCSDGLKLQCISSNLNIHLESLVGGMKLAYGTPYREDGGKAAYEIAEILRGVMGVTGSRLSKMLKHREYSPIQPPSDVERFQFRPRPLCRWFWESESYSHGSSSMNDLVRVVIEPVSVRSSKDLPKIRQTLASPPNQGLVKEVKKNGKRDPDAVLGAFPPRTTGGCKSHPSFEAGHREIEEKSGAIRCCRADSLPHITGFLTKIKPGSVEQPLIEVRLCVALPNGRYSRPG